MYLEFQNDIIKMNKVYDLKTVGRTRSAMARRLEQFKNILDKECAEIFDIPLAAAETPMAPVVAMADLLADIIVYCASEAVRWDIALPEILKIVMDSNFSKLGEDGKAIKDADDKFQKGPNYWKPEGMIEQLFLEWDLLLNYPIQE